MPLLQRIITKTKCSNETLSHLRSPLPRIETGRLIFGGGFDLAREIV
jgi:hypothetical protein